MTTSNTLEGKVALITGGRRELGRAMVLGLAETGADVIITSRHLDACPKLADEVTDRTGRRTLAQPVTSDGGRGWTPWPIAYAEFGRVDVLVNNAGMARSTLRSPRSARTWSTRCWRSTSRPRST